MATTTILLCGVGGQGTILAADLLARAAMASGKECKVSEIHGMAQRGGSVTSHVRMGNEGEHVASPLVGAGAADMLIAFEPGEAARMLGLLDAQGVLVTASNAKQPVTASLSKTVYAAAPVLEALKKREGPTVVVDESALLELVGNSKALNIVLLTVAISQRDAQGNPLLGISLDEFKEAIRVCVKPKFVDMNLAAVDAVCKELGLR